MNKLVRKLVGAFLLSAASLTVVHSQSLAPKKVNQFVQFKQQHGGLLSEEFLF